MSADTDAPPADGVEDAPRDEVREGILERVTAELGDAVVESHIAPGVGLWIRVAPEAWRTAGLVARDHLDCRWFDFLSAIDWMPSPYGRYEDDGFAPPAAPDTAIVTGIAGGDTRFQMLAHVVDVVGHTDVFLKADLADDDAPTIDSWVPLYDGADWHEREAWEMFGITFTGHPGLRHIYLPGDFEGYPLRKDFPLIARIVKPWPGIVDVEPMPAEDDEEGGEAAEGGDGA